MEPRDFYLKGTDILLEHSPPGKELEIAEAWYNSINRGVSQGTTAKPVGCVNFENGVTTLPTTNVAAGSSR